MKPTHHVHLAFLALSTALAPFTSAAEPEFVNVFTSGQEGYPNYRIPSLVVTKRGALLAVCEGRAKNDEVQILLPRAPARWLLGRALRAKHKCIAPDAHHHPRALHARLAHRWERSSAMKWTQNKMISLQHVPTFLCAIPRWVQAAEPTVLIAAIVEASSLTAAEAE